MNPAYAPGADALSTEYVAKHYQQPVGNSGFGGFVGMNIMFDAIQAAGDTNFDADMQNTRANVIVYQWQGVRPVAVFPDQARKEGVSLQPLARP